MLNELVIEKLKTEKSSNEIDSIKVLKSIADESLFYFAIFLTTLVILQLLPLIGGIFESFTFGVTEVAVSFIGYLNVFFLQFYNRILNRSGK